MIDYSKLSNEDLLALKNKDYTKVSSAGLQYVRNQTKPRPAYFDEPGLQDVSMTPITQPMVDETGEAAAEGIGGMHSNNPIVNAVKPYAGAAVGTAIQMAPDMLIAKGGAKPATEAAEGGASIGKSLLEKIKSFMKTPSSAAARTALESEMAAFESPTVAKAAEYNARNMKEPVEAVKSVRERLQSIPEHFRQKAELAEGLRKQAGEGMGAAEEAMGVPFKETSPKFEKFVKSPDKMARLAQRTAKITEAGPEQVAQTLAPKRIQLYRKLLQEGKGTLSNIGESSTAKSREVFSEALTSISGDLAKQRKLYHEAIDVIDGLPAAEKLAKESARRQLVQAQAELKKASDEAAKLMKAARGADAKMKQELKNRGLALIRQAEAKERLLKRVSIGTSIGGAVYVGKRFGK